MGHISSLCARVKCAGMYCFEIKNTVISVMSCLHTWLHLFIHLLPEAEKSSCGRQDACISLRSYKCVRRLVATQSPQQKVAIKQTNAEVRAGWDPVHAHIR